MFFQNNEKKNEPVGSSGWGVWQKRPTHSEVNGKKPGCHYWLYLIVLFSNADFIFY